MTTPLIPTKTILTSTKYTPAELAADRAFENFLFQLPNDLGLDFIRALMTAYRNGEASVSFAFNNNLNASEMANKLQSEPYGYEVTGPGSDPGRTITVTLTLT